MNTTPLAQITALENQARRYFDAGDYTQANDLLDQAERLRRQWERTRSGHRDRKIAKMLQAQKLARAALEGRRS